MFVGDFVLFFSVNLVVVTWLTYHFFCITKESSIAFVPIIYYFALIFSKFEFLFVFNNVVIVVLFFVLLIVSSIASVGWASFLATGELKKQDVKNKTSIVSDMAWRDRRIVENVRIIGQAIMMLLMLSVPILILIKSLIS